MGFHPSERQLEALLLHPERLTDETRDAMRQHISKCALCRDHWETLSLVYKNIDEDVKGEPTQRDRDFAGRLLAEEERLALPERGVVRHEETGLRDMLETYARFNDMCDRLTSG